MLERLAQDATPFGVDVFDPWPQLRPVPRQRLELHPDLRVAGLEVLGLVAPGGAPLLDEGGIGAVHLALALDEAIGEPLQDLCEELVDRAEVVVDEALVGVRLGGEPARRDPLMADLDQKALRGVEERLRGRVAVGARGCSGNGCHRG